MSLRRKTLLVVVATLAILLVILYIDARTTISHGRAGPLYFVLSPVAAGVAFGVVGLALVLERTVLSPLAHLSRSIASIGRSGDLSARVALRGGHELAWLAAEINSVLGALERSQSEWQQARAELQESAELLRSVVENIPIGIWVADREHRLRLWNAGLEAMSGISREEVLGRDIFERFPTPAADGLAALLRQVIETGEPLLLNDQPFSDPGLARAQYHLNIRANALKDPAGGVTGVVVAVEDISARKRAERVQAVAYRVADAANKGTNLEDLLRYVRQELGTIIDTKNFYIALYDPEQDLLRFPYYVDETFPEPGYDTARSRKPGRGLTEYVMRTGEALLASGDDIRALATKRRLEPSGVLPAVWLGAPLMSEERTIGAIAVQSYTDAAAYTQDDLVLLKFVSSQIGVVIERKRAEEALARSRDFYLTLFDEFPTPIRRSNTGGLCDYCNKSWLSFSGRSLQEETGDGWLAGVHPEDREHLLEVSQEAFAARQPFELEYRLRRHDGQFRWFIAVERPFHDLDGNFAGFLGSYYDVTDRKRLEEQFRQAQKMEAIGRLAGGIAHDFNNLLTAITGYASFARDALAPGDPAREDVAQVLSGAERAATLTRQLLTFSRRQANAPLAVNLNDVIFNLGKMLRRLISEDIELITAAAPDLGAVKVDPGQIEQVLINLAVNAGDAMPEGGRLTIETANVSLDAEYARQHVSVTPGDYVMFAVSDTGCGMNDEVKARIFEPFFTTKDPGKGTGLGLATCYGIVKQNGGHIWFYSEPGKGTTFKIYFPRVEAGVAEPPPIEERACPVQGGQTVLLVEDDSSVRSFAARVLREAGYTVLEAANGSEALELAARHEGSPIHLLVTDVVMPQMGGEELASRLKASHPELRSLFVSGYTAQAAVRNGTLGEDVAFLQKPFTLTTLVRKVREVLGDQQA